MRKKKLVCSCRPSGSWKIGLRLGLEYWIREAVHPDNAGPMQTQRGRGAALHTSHTSLLSPGPALCLPLAMGSRPRLTPRK